MCLLGVSLTLLTIFGVKSPENPNFGGVNRRFKAKTGKILKVSCYRNSCIDFDQILHSKTAIERLALQLHVATVVYLIVSIFRTTRRLLYIELSTLWNERWCTAFAVASRQTSSKICRRDQSSSWALRFTRR